MHTHICTYTHKYTHTCIHGDLYIVNLAPNPLFMRFLSLISFVIMKCYCASTGTLCFFTWFLLNLAFHTSFSSIVENNKSQTISTWYCICDLYFYVYSNVHIIVSSNWDSMILCYSLVSRASIQRINSDCCALMYISL